MENDVDNSTPETPVRVRLLAQWPAAPQGGIRGRRGRAAAQEAFEAAVGEFQTTFRLWDRHWVACMIGNGYGVGDS